VRSDRVWQLLLTTCLASTLVFGADSPHVNGRYIATAYSVTGKTASGLQTNRHVVAADPAILPVGSIIKIRHVGRYQGEYVVADTGEKIVGRKLDIYMPSTVACKKFGKRAVHVHVVKLGEGTHEDTKTSDHVVKQDVEQDLQKGVVGNAATQQDWVTKDGPAKATALKPDGGGPTPAPAESDQSTQKPPK